MQSFTFDPIGIIRTPYLNIKDMPIQPRGASGIRGTLILDPAYRQGIKDLDGFSHIFLIYVFHQAGQPQMTVIPFLDQQPHGVFATRAPKRPNPIGLSIVRLIRVDENRLTLENVDMLDGSPVIDIKPYVPAFDQPEKVKVGWLSKSSQAVNTKRSDDRFK
jgi:tRNA-Thr(GGU) m(6)t(6)A37 methyltransferase TsaA